jgi:hypothetical protein
MEIEFVNPILRLGIVSIGEGSRFRNFLIWGSHHEVEWTTGLVEGSKIQKGSKPMLNGSHLDLWFLNQFSQWKPTNITFCDNQFENWSNGSHPSEIWVTKNRFKKKNRIKSIHERTKIHFSNFQGNK